MASQKHETDLATLRASIASITTLISKFQVSLTSQAIPHPLNTDLPNPLRLLQDASTLLKAQTTKLSLLILNKPFTPSAIFTIVGSLGAESLPALISAYEICQPEEYTLFLRDHIREQTIRILREIKVLLESIPTEAVDKEGKEGRSTLANTRVVWEVCDALISLANNGLVDFATRRAESYHILLKDAIAELEDWDPDGDDDEEDAFRSIGSSESDTEQEEQTSPPSAALMHVMTLTPPPTPSPMRRMYAETLATLRVIRLLYPPLKKRRIQAFPSITSRTMSSGLPGITQIKCLNSLLNYLQLFSESADELAGSLYSRDVEDAEESLTTLKNLAMACVESAKLNWNGVEDEFSVWSEQWLKRLNTSGASADGT